MHNFLPVLALVFNAFTWGVSWWPFRQLGAMGLHPLWLTGCIYSIAVVVLLRTAERLAGQPAYAVRTPEGWQHTTWQTYGAEVRLAARALLTLGVRPEAIALGGDVPARVSSLEYLGSDLVLRCAVGSEQITDQFFHLLQPELFAGELGGVVCGGRDLAQPFAKAGVESAVGGFG